MPDRDVNTIKDLSCCQYATIIAKSAFAASDGESSLRHRGGKKFYDSIPPLVPSAAAAPAPIPLDNEDVDGDDEITALDIDWVLGGGGVRGQNL